jgi:DNA-binding transcriptional regulator YiaG
MSRRILCLTLPYSQAHNRAMSRAKRARSLRAFRVDLGMTQVEFAGWLSSRLGYRVGQPQVSRWERGRGVAPALRVALRAVTQGRVTMQAVEAVSP